MYVSAETERWSVRIESRIVYAHLIYHIIYCFRVIYSIEREWRESTSESTYPSEGSVNMGNFPLLQSKEPASVMTPVSGVRGGRKVRRERREEKGEQRTHTTHTLHTHLRWLFRGRRSTWSHSRRRCRRRARWERSSTRRHRMYYRRSKGCRGSSRRH